MPTRKCLGDTEWGGTPPPCGQCLQLRRFFVGEPSLTQGLGFTQVEGKRSLAHLVEHGGGVPRVHQPDLCQLTAALEGVIV